MPRHLLRRAPVVHSTPPDHAPQPIVSQVQAQTVSPRPAIMEMPPGFPVDYLYHRRPVARTASASASSSATTARWPQGVGIAMDNSLDTMEMEDQEGGDQEEEEGDEEFLGHEQEHEPGREHHVDVEHGGLDEVDEEDEEMQDRSECLVHFINSMTPWIGLGR